MKLEFRNKWMNKQWGFNAILSFFPNLIFHAVVVIVTLNFQWNEMNENKKKSWGSYWDREFLFVFCSFKVFVVIVVDYNFNLFSMNLFFLGLVINRNDVSVDGHGPKLRIYYLFKRLHSFFLVWWNIYHLKWIKRVANS